MFPINIGISAALVVGGAVAGYLTKFIYDNRDDLSVQPIDEALNPKPGQNGFDISSEQLKQVADDLETIQDACNKAHQKNS